MSKTLEDGNSQGVAEATTRTWRGALKELKIDTEKHRRFDDEELTPDSMSSRIDSGVGGLDQRLAEDAMFDRMGSRVEAVGV